MAKRVRIEIDLNEHRVWRNGELVAVRPKVFDLLRLFVENPERLLAKALIRDRLWGNTHVSDASVKDCIRNLRGVLQDDAEEPTFIETVRGRGYRYLGGIELRNGSPAPSTRKPAGFCAILSMAMDRKQTIGPPDAPPVQEPLQGTGEDVLSRCIHEHGGSVLRTTPDCMLAVFPDANGAVLAAIAIQRANEAACGSSRGDGRRIRLGITLSRGGGAGSSDVSEDEAFRLQQWADPGGILVSKSASLAIGRQIGLHFEDMGTKALQNIDPPLHAYRLASASTLTTSPDAVAFKGPRRPSLAILPFRNLSEDGDHSFVADGIGLGIHTLLVRLPGLFFINAVSHEACRNGTLTAADAGRDLQVDHVLEGAVQRSGNRVRVTAQVTDVKSNAGIWAETFDRTLDDIFTLQDDIAREVISAVIGEIHGGNLDRIWTRGFTHPQAWEYYLKGIDHFYRFTPRDNDVAREQFEALHRVHPEKSLGKSYVALTHWIDATRSWAKDNAKSRKKAREWAELAVEPQEDNIGLAHSILGTMRILESRHEDGLRLCRQAIDYRANCPFALGQLAFAETYCGETENAVKSARSALSVRLLYPPQIVNILATAYRDSGRYQQAILAAHEAVRLAPGHIDAHVTLCSSQFRNGDVKAAKETASHILKSSPAFHTARFVSTLPYRDSAMRDAIETDLRHSGLP